MIISVTQEDIRNGKPRNPFYCPVNLAIERATATNAMTISAHCSLNSGAVVDLPPEVQAFIRQFDGLLPVQPFQFTLEVPEWPKKKIPLKS